MNMDLAHQALKTYFGYDSFRQMQEEVIQSVFDGQDTLVLMPTGGGKSICFQIPALTLPGLCVVVSPLIALMKDQVEGLLANGVAAAYLNSSQDSSTQRTIEHDLLNGQVKLLYVSPEKLLSDQFLHFLSKLSINLFAIDEAHCISTWGHDFRQEYAQMSILKTRFPKVPMIALTATADLVTRKDIVEKLAIPQANQFVSSFDRPNLSLNVLPGQKRFQTIRDFIKQRPKQAGIVYCLSRKSTENLSEKLRAAGIVAAAYHAGLSDVQRARNQEAFVKDDIHIICATIAFGMGIDKSNVRWIIHYNLPKNLESFYQQIGRAGRDGLQSETILFYSYQDIRLLQSFFEDSSQKELLSAKLDRMKQYAESVTCRREILLNYFNEDKEVKCGTCDNCLNPPEVFDGTVIAQKALSAVARSKERVGSNLLVDVLRGSRKQQILQMGLHQIKTYGVGSDISYFDWSQYLLQLLNKGYLHIAFDEHSNLKLTEKSKKVLFDGEQVNLVRPSKAKEKLQQQKEKAKPKTKKEILRTELFEILRTLRLEIARSRGVPPYLVFHDSTLSEMAQKYPTTDEELLEISGFSERKLQLYGSPFAQAILDHLWEKDKAGYTPKGKSAVLSFQYFLKGKNPAEIAELRSITENTVLGHLADQYEAGKKIDVEKLISEGEFKKIKYAIKATGNQKNLKALFLDLNQEIPYSKIRIALHYLNA